MAILYYKINPDGESRRFELVSHANQPGQTLVRIGSDPAPDVGVEVLRLPEFDGLAPVHAWIYETKSPPQFVLVDWAPGYTWVNQLPVTRLKTLNHRDHIRIGRPDKPGAVELIYQEVFLTELKEEFECPVCCKNYEEGEMVFQCPKCIDSTYCFDCVVHGGLKCHCGYNFRTVVSSVLTNASIKNFFTGAAADTLVIEVLDDMSSLIDKNCRVKPHSLTQASLVPSFKSGDRVVYCPECSAPYHLDCWLRLERCANRECKGTHIQKKLLEILLADM